jgi:ABC-type multidrug transport system ATPase subunit
MSVIAETKGLTKKFGDNLAVNDLSFSIAEGDIYGFLGENGAGKSTTIRMLLGLVYPTSGKVYIKGNEFNNRRRYLLQHIGAIIERPDMYGYLSGWDNLRMFARMSFKDIPEQRLHEVLEIVGLKGREADKVRAYSQGMKQRLGIAIALVHSPELLILDEPTNGLDPQGIAEMRALILQLSKEHGKTILISSHLLHEIEQVATKILVIHKGRKMVEGNAAELLNPVETLIDIKIEPFRDLPASISTTTWQQFITAATPNSITFKMHPGQVPALNKWLVEQGVQVLEIRSRHSLEAYFLSLTNDTATPHRAI